MKKKIAVIACSNACLDYFDYDYNIPIFRSTLHLGGKDYLDYIDLSAEDFYNKLENDKSLFPSTSYMPIGQMIEIYEQLADDGYTDAIVVSISKEMSGIVSAATIAAKQVSGLKVSVFDSKTLAYPEALMALKASKMADEGFDVPDILTELEYIKANNKIYFAVNTLTYLVKNGRLSSTSGLVGNLAKIKPVLTISSEGKVVNYEKIRTFKRAVDRLLEIFFEETKNIKVEPFIIHANNLETVQYMKSKLLENNIDYKEVFVMPLTAVVGAHSGPKTVGLGYIKSK